MLNIDTQAWLELEQESLDADIEIDGKHVYLKRHSSGSELGVYLLEDYTGEQLRAALQQGFASAMQFDAGLSTSEDGNALLLTQWLPGVSSWAEVAIPLEKLLNQLETWRTVLAMPEDKRAFLNAPDRNAERFRMLLSKGK
jgi:hypothetical protein